MRRRSRWRAPSMCGPAIPLIAWSGRGDVEAMLNEVERVLAEAASE